MTGVRVLLVDDDPLVLAALTMMLKGAEGVAVVGQAANGQEALRAVTTTPVDVVLMDIRMPAMDGLSATEAIRARPSPPEIIVLTTFDADRHVHRALSAGAVGFLLKDTPPDHLVDAIRRAASGDPVLSPSVLRGLIRRSVGPENGARSRRAEEARGRLAPLAERERQVALEVGRGLSNADIARALHLSVPTVKTHVSAALARLGLTNRVQLALLVREAELDQPDPDPG
ncbi:response regulator transcription factor [Actinoalloteichus caeruleus]|uniref:response regulator transcription factor n=1 Tax=Actinoalloteichus cyanogriseus TaxID=2893586 RepID=UPI0004AB5BF6|nr:response regulator transcription factor [Actinoalloteichus caeruleus]